MVKETTSQPFGEARDAKGVENSISPSESHGYIGERYDAGPELQFLNARYYDPKLSLFTSPDWLDVTLPGVGTNRFAYAGNSPVNQSDPSGNCPMCAAAGFGAWRGSSPPTPTMFFRAADGAARATMRLRRRPAPWQGRRLVWQLPPSWVWALASSPELPVGFLVP